MSVSSLDRLPEPQDWERQVAHEARRQAQIEAAFDRADAWEQLGDHLRALEWLAEADSLSGGLPPAYHAKRALLARELARSRGRAL